MVSKISLCNPLQQISRENTTGVLEVLLQLSVDHDWATDWKLNTINIFGTSVQKLHIYQSTHGAMAGVQFN